MRLPVLLLVLPLVFSADAFAKKKKRRAAPMSGSSDMRGKNSGLCTANDSGQPQVKLGWCKVIEEALTKDGSEAKKLLDQIVQNGGTSAAKINGMNEFCPQYDQLAANEHSRTLFFQNLIANTIIPESGWKTGETGDGGKSKGLCQLSESDAKVYKGDCEKLNGSNIMSANFDAVTTHLKCCTQVVLTNLLYGDGPLKKKVDMSMSSKNGKKNYGIGRYFGPYQEGRKEKTALVKRMSEYCTYAAGSGGQPPANPDAEAMY